MILLYNTNATLNPNAYLTLAIEDALRALVGARGVTRVDARTLAPAAAAGGCRLLLCIDGQRLDAGLIARVKPAVGRVALWVFEDPFMLDYNLGNLDLFDLVFTNDPSCAAAYGSRGYYLPLAASPALQRRAVLDDTHLRTDIFFAGTMWPNRIAALRRVIAAFPDATMKLVCPTNEYLPPLPTQIAERAISRPISHAAFIDFANASRVTLTLFRDYASHGAAGFATAPGPRLFELGLAGTAQVVCRDPRMPSRHFDGLDGISIETGETLNRRICEILADPRLRHDLATRAQNSVLGAHDYQHRLRALLAQCAIEPGAPAPAAMPPKPRKRLRVLMCTHSTVQDQAWGGVEVHQQMLCAHLERDVEAFTWVRRNGTCLLLDQRGRILERFDGEDIGWLDVLCDAFEERHFSNVLSSYDIDIVHFQHLGHHPASLPLIAKSAGCGTVLSVHDFFLVCARYNLLDHEQKFCDIGTRAISACTICLGAAEALPAGAQQQRRGFIELVLASVDLLLFGSRQSETLIQQIYPQTRAMRRLVLGVPAPPAAVPRAGRNADADTPDADINAALEVMVIGNFLRTKGADTVLAVIDAAPPERFRFHILGEAEPRYLQPLAAFGERVVYHGRHAPGALSLSHGQVALHLSIWPETWCLSLSEAWEAGLIPIVTDIGALGERVAHGVDGFKVRVGDAGAVLDLLEMLRANPSLRARIRRGIGPHLWTDAAAYAARILAEYHSLTPKVPLGVGRALGLEVSRLHLLATPRWKELAGPRHILDAQAECPVRLELPQSIAGFASIQQCSAYVDAICGEETDPGRRDRPGEVHRVEGFSPVPRFSIQGWIFHPDASQAGQVFVCLLHQGNRHVVFLEAERVARADVHATHPDAPLRSGYSAEITLRGKWADGEYAIGVLVVISGQAAFQLSRHLVWLLDGMVTALATAHPGDDAVLRGFARVFASSPAAERFGFEQKTPPTRPLPPAAKCRKPHPARAQKLLADVVQSV